MDTHTPYSRVGGEGNDCITGRVAAFEGTWLALRIREHLAEESLARGPDEERATELGKVTDRAEQLPVVL